MPEEAYIPIWEVRNTMLNVVQLLRTYGLPGPAECVEIVDRLEKAANAKWLIGIPNPNAPEDN
jgi:hypothetical protein